MARRRWTIRIVYAGLLLVALAILAGGAGQVLIGHLGGAWRHQPEDARWLLSDGAQALVARAYQGLDGPVLDHRVHLLSLGQAKGRGYDNRSFVHARFLRGWDPRARLYGRILRDAAGIRDLDRADAEYVARLVRLGRSLPGAHRIRLAALDQRYDGAGRPRSEQTPYHVDNDYVVDIAGRYPDLFSPIVSIHPLRPDAVEALARWAEQGVRGVQWWPAVQDFDPADERLDAYYRALVEHDLTLLARTGDARGLTDGVDAYGDPWRYRRALERGVRVVLSGGGGGVRYPDPTARTDAKGETPRITGVAVFMQLLRETGEDARLYADLGALTHGDRVPQTLARLLQHPDVFARLVYASDYPLPAMNAAAAIEALADQGFVTAAQAAALAEIYDVNPLLFDFVAMRLLRLPHTDLGLPDAVFTRDALASR
jgi:mannonate dehydratase